MQLCACKADAGRQLEALTDADKQNRAEETAIWRHQNEAGHKPSLTSTDRAVPKLYQTPM
jgi:hypothetical protein